MLLVCVGAPLFVIVIFKEVFVPSCLSAVFLLGCLGMAKIGSHQEKARGGGKFSYQP